MRKEGAGIGVRRTSITQSIWRRCITTALNMKRSAAACRRRQIRRRGIRNGSRERRRGYCWKGWRAGERRNNNSRRFAHRVRGDPSSGARSAEDGVGGAGRLVVDVVAGARGGAGDGVLGGLGLRLWSERCGGAMGSGQQMRHARRCLTAAQHHCGTTAC